MEVCGLPNAEPVFNMFTSIINRDAKTGHSLGVRPTWLKHTLIQNWTKPNSTSTQRLTWLLKRLLQTLTVCCCRTAEKPKNVPLSELSLCRSPTVHCAKNDYLRYPCADAPETDVRFSRAHCLHEPSLAHLPQLS